MITSLLPWFGTNRANADKPAALLKGCSWIGVPFMGGGCELRHLQARTIVASDLHGHLINLALVVADAELVKQLYDRLNFLPHHAAVLEAAQERCEAREVAMDALWFGEKPTKGPDVDWAVDYFVSAWWSRNGNAGTTNEFSSPLSVRWESGGGDSATRVRNAIGGLPEFHEWIRRVTFLRLDCFQFLDKVFDDPEQGIYADPPFPDAGDSYRYSFTEDDHERLSDRLYQFEHAKIVCRFHDHKLIRGLYPETHRNGWKWHRSTSKAQDNTDRAEVFLERIREAS